MPQAMSIALASTTPYTKQHLISLSSTAVKYYYQIQSSKFNLYVHTPHPQVSPLFCSRGNYKKREKFSRYRVIVKASGRETPYQVLGVSSSATPDQIKRAYRKLALKYHPDVNKQADAQEKFMRIKHAYNTLLSSKSKDGSSGYSYSNSERNRNRTSQDEEDFYGLGDFFKDLQEEYRNWETNGASQGKPKSLWEELADIGEEFVEFLEKELNINDVEVEQEKNRETEKDKGSSTSSSSNSSLEENIDEIEAALAQLKKELGL